MNTITLIKPTKEYEVAALKFRQEFYDHDEKIINGSALLDQLDYPEWLAHVKKYSKAETVGDDWVPSTTYFAIANQKLIGIIDIRHHINHPFLKDYGGHIGYSVRPTERLKGYATEMLALALDYSRELKLNKVMLGCYADNEGSIRTIRNHGGELTEEKLYIDGTPMHIYWIEL